MDWGGKVTCDDEPAEGPGVIHGHPQDDLPLPWTQLQYKQTNQTYAVQTNNPNVCSTGKQRQYSSVNLPTTLIKFT